MESKKVINKNVALALTKQQNCISVFNSLFLALEYLGFGTVNTFWF